MWLDFLQATYKIHVGQKPVADMSLNTCHLGLLFLSCGRHQAGFACCLYAQVVPALVPGFNHLHLVLLYFPYAPWHRMHLDLSGVFICITTFFDIVYDIAPVAPHIGNPWSGCTSQQAYAKSPPPSMVPSTCAGF